MTDNPTSSSLVERDHRTLEKKLQWCKIAFFAWSETVSAYNHTSHGALDMQTASDVLYSRALRVSGARPAPLLELAKKHIEDDFPKVGDWVHVTGNL